MAIQVAKALESVVAVRPEAEAGPVDGILKF